MRTPSNRGKILFDQKRYDLALREFTSELTGHKTDPALHAMISLCHMNLGKFQPARLAAEAAISCDPQSSSGYYALAWCFYNDKRLSAYRPGEIPRYINRANAPSHRLKKAAATIDQALQISPTNIHALMLKSLIACDSWNPRLALETANQALAIDPTFAPCLRLRALALQAQGRVDDAHSAASSALAQQPENAASHYTMGLTELLKGRTRAATQHFLEALRLDPMLTPPREALLRAKRGQFLFYRPLFWLITRSRIPHGKPIGKLFNIPVVIGLSTFLQQPDVYTHLSPRILPIILLLFPTSLHSLANYLLLFDPVISGMLSARERATFLYSFTVLFALFAYAAIAALSWNLRWIASPPLLACFLCFCAIPSLAATLSRPRQSLIPTADLD